jgi:hypothetical protein
MPIIYQFLRHFAAYRGKKGVLLGIDGVDEISMVYNVGSLID